MYLTSPHGTKSQLLARRPHDSSRAGFHDWPFLTVFCWGENPAGTWELEIQNEGRYAATLTSWSITFHGTSEDPDKVALPGLSPTPAPPNPSPAQSQPQTPQPPPKPEAPKFASSAPVYQAPTSAASIEHCAQMASPDFCQACEVGFKTLAGRCVRQCPGEGYYQVSFPFL